MNRVGHGIAMSGDEVRHTFVGYRFAVLDTDEINAFAAPGGTIFVSRGMIERTQDEDELAGVLAHEIAHVSLRHGLAAIKKSNMISAFQYLGASAAQATLSASSCRRSPPIFDDSIQDVLTTLVKSGYSRDAEYEADPIGPRVRGGGIRPARARDVHRAPEVGRRAGRDVRHAPRASGPAGEPRHPPRGDAGPGGPARPRRATPVRLEH